MPHLTSESFDQCDSSNLRGYQFVNQGIFYLLTFLYMFHDIQYLMHIVVNFLLQTFIIFVPSKLRASLVTVISLLI
jgi:hypothetical protein